MTQNIQPNMNSDLDQATVRSWFQALSNGVLEGFDVTPGASGFQINIASGKVVLGGSTIHDDLTRTNLALLTHVPGFNEHHIVYAQYTPQETFPPPAMTIGVVKTSAASPAKPAAPSIPADAVKLADIFIDTAAVTWGSGTQIINTPKLPARGLAANDVLLDRLINSNANIIVSGGGSLTYDGVDEFTWSQAFTIIAPVVSSRESYFTAATASGTIAAGTLGPSPVVGPNSIIFTVFDRRTPNAIGSPVALSLHVLNLDNPDPTERALFFNATTREQIVMIASIIGGVLRTRGDIGLNLPPPPAEPPPKVLHIQSGSPVWDSLDDSFFTGSARSVADATARDAIDATQRKQGMIVYVQSEDEYYSLVGGLTNASWTKMQNDNRLTGGTRIISWNKGSDPAITTHLANQIPTGRRVVGMNIIVRETVAGQQHHYTWDGSVFLSVADIIPGRFGVNPTYGNACAITNPDNNTIQIDTGELTLLDGRRVIIAAPISLSITGLVSGTSYWIVWNGSTGTIETQQQNSVTSGMTVLGFIVRTSGFVTRFLDLRPFRRDVQTGPGAASSPTEITVGSSSGGMFSSLLTAVAWSAAYRGTPVVAVARTISVLNNITVPATTTIATADVTQSGSDGLVNSVGARFKQKIEVGAQVRISSANYVVTAVTDDDNIVIANWPTPGTTSGLSVSRLNHTSNYGEHLDFTSNKPEINASAFMGLQIVGGNRAQTSRATVTWGTSSYAATKPFFNAPPPGMRLAGLKFSYSGLSNFDPTTMHDTVFVKGPTQGVFDDVIVDCGSSNTSSLTHLMNISGSVGGDNENPPFLATRCVFQDIGGPTKSWIYISSTSAAGRLTFEKTEFECTYSADAIWLESGVTTNSLDVLADNCEFSNIFVFCYDALGSDEGVERKITNSRVNGVNVAGNVKLSIVNNFLLGEVADLKLGCSLSAPVSGEVTVTGLTGMSADHVGQLLEVYANASGGNLGSFVITEFVSATSVKIWNPSGTLDASVDARLRLSYAMDFGDLGDISAFSTPTQDVDDLTGMSANKVNGLLVLQNAFSPGNNGQFKISAFVDDTKVQVSNTAGASSDTNDNQLRWAVYANFESGNAGSISSVTNGVSTVTGLTGMSRACIGKFLTIGKASNAGNNGKFLIVDYVNSTSVKILNANGVAGDASLIWALMESADTKRFSTYQSTFDANVDMVGGHLISDCQPTVVSGFQRAARFGRRSRCDNCDFIFGFPADFNASNVGESDRMRSAMSIRERLNIGQYTAIAGFNFAIIPEVLRQARVVSGCRLYSAGNSPVNADGGFFWSSPYPTLRPGTIITPYGRTVTWRYSLIGPRLLVSRSGGVNTYATDIDGTSPNPSVNWYDELRFYFVRLRADEYVPKLVFSLKPPRPDGMPQTTAEAGYQISDYTYVGAAYSLSALGSSGTYSTISTFGTPIYIDENVRKIPIAKSFPVSLSAAGGANDTATLLSGAGAAQFVNFREWEWSGYGMLNTAAGGTSPMQRNLDSPAGNGVWNMISSTDEAPLYLYNVSPVGNGGASVKLTTLSGGSTSTFDGSFVLQSVYENVNLLF